MTTNHPPQITARQKKYIEKIRAVHDGERKWDRCALHICPIVQKQNRFCRKASQ
jgi:hypothetical protein